MSAPLDLVRAAVAICIATGWPSAGANAQDIVAPPACENDSGETVEFIDAGGRDGSASGMANRDKDGTPVVYRSNYASAPPELQAFMDRHECAHHQTGDVDRPHPPRNGPEHLMNESIADCVAILRLRDEEDYDEAAFEKVAAALRYDMEAIGFPEISVSSRIDNIRHCYDEYGPPGAFIEGVLERRR